MMSEFILTCLVGLAATSLMTFTLYLFHWRGFANGDMVRALGSLVTKKYENSVKPGLMIHALGGVVFALVYVYVWSQFPEITDGGIVRYMQLGAFCGFAQGLVTSISLVIFVAEYHPLQQFRVVGMNVALVHLLAHVVYGTAVGAMAGALHLAL
jgi:hypothetical protein